MIVPWPPGAVIDVVGRQIAERLGKSLGQPVIVDNRPGASGTIGLALGAQAQPDGYTITFASSSNLVIAPALLARAPYDAVTDFEPITQTGESPVVLLVHPSLAVRDVQALIALAKKQPGKLAYGSSGVGSVTHLTGELFKHATGIELLHVPFKGNPETQRALLANEIPMSFDIPLVALPQVKAGKLQALLVTGTKRAKALPDVPTALEAGVPDFVVHGWAGFVAPARTPANVIAVLQAQIAHIVQSGELRRQVEESGGEAIGSTSEQFRAFLGEEAMKWKRVIKLAGIQAQ
jgi:tripartite-type tricarboxylate transporter receptor subunit TctC